MWIILIIIAICVGAYLLVKRAGENTEQSAEQIGFNSNSRNYAFNIVGEQAYQDNLQKIAGKKEEDSKFVEVVAKVSSDPFNAYDKNAVKVEINGLLVGFLSREDAKHLARKVINKNVPAVINGGWLDEDSEGSYGVKLAINNIKELE